MAPGPEDTTTSAYQMPNLSSQNTVPHPVIDPRMWQHHRDNTPQSEDTSDSGEVLSSIRSDIIDIEEQDDGLPQTTTMNPPPTGAQHRTTASSMPGVSFAQARQSYPTAFPSVNPVNTTGTAHIPATLYNTSTVRTPDMMPLLGARSAPAKFSGKYDTVKRFICQYKQMITRFVEALDSFVKEDWVQLEKDILTYYDAELNESRYLVSDLDKLTDQWRSKGIYDLKRFKKYEVEFLTMANWLLHKGKITLDEQHTKFWYGLNGNLQEIVEARYMTSHPRYDPRKVIPREDVAKIVYAMFTRDRFDADLTARKSKDRRAKLRELLKMTTTEDKTSGSDEDSDSSNLDDDSDYEDKRHRNNSESDDESDEDEPREKSKKRRRNQDNHWQEKLEEKDEVEELVEIYYRALKMDTTIADIVAPPIRRTGAIFPPMQRSNFPPPPQF
ncbi:hypothetical protein ARMGADRAFT_1090340 [Armillaria gallica]|uniref:Uncharacterized protein n=1 Tax=Armillaria gallica TaxID=47427 RepID=A0A2H3D0B7_ARMGA|nr:hypothetical protein ARMGADRAFT_1090340 [Armillaria gallica]